MCPSRRAAVLILKCHLPVVNRGRRWARYRCRRDGTRGRKCGSSIPLLCVRTQRQMLLPRHVRRPQQDRARHCRRRRNRHRALSYSQSLHRRLSSAVARRPWRPKRGEISVVSGVSSIVQHRLDSVLWSTKTHRLRREVGCCGGQVAYCIYDPAGSSQC